MDGPDDPAALPYAKRGSLFSPGNPWRFQSDGRTRSQESVATSQKSKTDPAAVARDPVREPVIQQRVRPTEDYVPKHRPGITASDEPLPFGPTNQDVSCTGCIEDNRKNSQGRYNRAGMYVKMYNLQTGALSAEGNFCKSCYRTVLHIWSQHRSEFRFRFSTDLRPGI